MLELMKWNFIIGEVCKMKIVTLTLAPAFDIHCNAERIDVNHENIAHITDYNAGGKGINISRALANFGYESLAIVVMGDENGDNFEKMLKNENICFQKISIKGKIRENITIHTADCKETRISFTADNAPPELLQRVEKITDEICESGDVLTFTGRIPEGVSVDSAKKYIKRLSERGVLAVIDSRSFSLQDMLEVKPFLIKPNEEEISAYMGRNISDFDSASAAARELSEGGIENVIISLGEKGALISSHGCVYTVEAPKINAVSTVGAGDSAIAGFLYALSQGKSTYECLKSAVAFGSAACMTCGTTPPKKYDVEMLLSKM